jgi:hypothetical protein
MESYQNEAWLSMRLEEDDSLKEAIIKISSTLDLMRMRMDQIEEVGGDHEIRLRTKESAPCPHPDIVNQVTALRIKQYGIIIILAVIIYVEFGIMLPI